MCVMCGWVHVCSELSVWMCVLNSLYGLKLNGVECVDGIVRVCLHVPIHVCVCACVDCSVLVSVCGKEAKDRYES